MKSLSVSVFIMDAPSTRTGSKMNVRTTNAIAAATTNTIIHSKISCFMLFLGFCAPLFSISAFAMGIMPLS